MKNLLYSLLFVIPKNIVSYVFGLLAAFEFPQPLQIKINTYFSNLFAINLNEADRELSQYHSLNAFFTRKLKNGLRPIAEGVVHPADSKLTQFARIKEGTLIQAKGFSFHLNEFLGQSPYYQRLKDGYFFTYYLCPTDYHRVHSPVEGRVLQSLYLPGQLWPVNDWSVNKINNLFAVNERVVTFIDTDRGLCALVMVGATNVGKMTLSFDCEVTTNQFLNRTRKETVYDPQIPLQKGDEVGTFHMGSTVVMIYEKTFFEDIRFARGGSVKMGQTLLK